jgi:DNA-binding response OmpR family regulator
MTARPAVPPVAPPARILVVDDEPKLCESVAEGLRLEGWIVVTAASVAAANGLLGAERFDLLVLDWMLPDGDGLELLQRVRAITVRMPVLVMTARNSHYDEAIAFESGASEFLTKPFAFGDLLARCQALLSPAASVDRIILGNAELDRKARVLRRHGDEVALTAIEAAVLDHLFRRPKEVATFESIARQVWKHERPPSARQAIVADVQRLMQKLGRIHGPLIQPVPGIGYLMDDRLGSNAGSAR